jgi:hypothetical protein
VNDPRAALAAILAAVDGCDGAFLDDTYRRLFVWRGGVVQAFDTGTGQAWDAPWPVDPVDVAARGWAAILDAVTERVNRGY